MTRCQHCKKLTHSEHIVVEYNIEDQDKIHELISLENWIPHYLYHEPSNLTTEYGKLKCGDIWIHFKIKENREVTL